MRFRNRVLPLFALLSLWLASPAGARAGSETMLDPSLLAGLEARAIGPAGMSGRVAAILVDPSDKDTIYVGAATGGLWKSTNGGLRFEPLFDDQPVAAIGSIAIRASQPDVIWVGTGEGNPRNSASVGNGIYRSRDGGVTWEHLGLDKSERIHRILLHPDRPEVAWACALGPSWGDGGERGVYRTRDGGTSWQRILSANERTGCADLELDPANPDKLIATLWEHRRWPWFFDSGGEGSGVFLTWDGGDTWREVTDQDGLPKGELGRIGLAIAPSNPKIVYAVVEAEENGIYRSVDGGRKWKKVTGEGDFGNRPFYYADLRVDPGNPNRVYSLWSLVSVSIDAGKTWRILVPFRSLHPDHHAMWIDPEDSSHLWNGNDGGIGESRDYGETWRFVSNLPLAQYYHVAVDDDTPYNIYGGMQDNGSWRGPSSVWENGGIRNHHWEEVGFGDGFDTRPDPLQPHTGYAMSQQGFLLRWDLETGARRMIRPSSPDQEVELRFNWNAGLALDPFRPGTIYFGSQYVHMSEDRGETWTAISKDLTTNNPDWQKQNESGGLTLDVTGAENFTSIVSIAASPRKEGVLWVGTDDGRLHVTRDRGLTWASLERKFRGVPRNTWIPHIAPSPHEPGTAFVVFDDHRRNNWTTYVWKVEDYGRRVRRLPTGEVRGYALVIEQDPVDPELLFLGTEFGLWVSLDAGRHWFQWKHGVPTVSVMDMAIQAREGDLVLGTHGRAAFVLDDISPLRELDGSTLDEPIHLFDIPDAVQYRVRQTGASRFPGQGEFRGTNRPRGALITFSLKHDSLPHPDEDVERELRKSRGDERREAESEEGEEEDKKDSRPKAKFHVSDSDGKIIRTFERPVTSGVNRVVWGFETDPFLVPRDPEDEHEGGGPEVIPGIYTVSVEYGDSSASGPVRVLPDPRTRVSDDQRRMRWSAIQAAGSLREVNTKAIERIQRARADVDVYVRHLETAQEETRRAVRDRGEAPDEDALKESPEGKLLTQARKLKKGLKELEEKLWDPPGTKGIRGDTTTSDAIGLAQWFLGSGRDAPSATQLEYLYRAERRLRPVLEEVDTFFREDVESFRDGVRAAEIRLLSEHCCK